MNRLALIYIGIVIAALLGCNGHWNKGDRMRDELTRMKELYKSDSIAYSDSAFTEMVAYFKHHGTSNERVLAQYLLGRTYAMMGDAPQALQTYYDAIEEADTTDRDCDYRTLVAVYGQMARIFHHQFLPHDEIWALNHYVNCIKNLGDDTEYAVAQSQLVRPYYLLGEKDTVLLIIHDAYAKLHRLGQNKRAAGLLPAAIYIHTERGELDEACRMIDEFEHHSGVFDEKGEIAKGREHYYSTKGVYLLAVNKIDSAEWCFRKVLRYGYLSDGYKGLLSVYRHKHVLDSIVRFSRLYEDAQDSLHNQMQIDAIHRMAAMYDYNRSQKELEKQNQKARTARLWIGVILSLVAVCAILVFRLYRKRLKKKQEQISQLDRALANAKNEYTSIQDELQKLKNKDFEGLIAEKERKEQELRKTIEELIGGSDTDDLKKFESSEIVAVFNKKKVYKPDVLTPKKAEWRALEVEFSKDMPCAYKMLAKEKRLSPLELHVCMLLILGFEDSSIVNLTDSLPQTITTAKSRANKKVFNEKGAQTLKAGLLQLIKAD